MELDVKYKSSLIYVFFFFFAFLFKPEARSIFVHLFEISLKVGEPFFLFYRQVRRNFSQIGNTVNLLPLICLKVLLQFMNFFELLLFMPRSIKLFLFIIINDIYPGSSTHSKVVLREVLHPLELE